MNYEIKDIRVSEFKEHLIKNGYSKHVIPMYIRKVTAFLEYKIVAYSVSPMDYSELKRIICEYVAEIPLTSQKGMIQAALHCYYYFVSGNQFARRLNTKDFNYDMSIESEIKRFQKYLRSG